jgi:arylsulfatase A-like enzyme
LKSALAIFVVMSAAGCNRAVPSKLDAGPTSAASAAERPAPAPLPGDRLAYRFLDHAADATYEGAPLDAAWRALEHPAKIVSPYAKLPGDAALRVVELALADADVGAYGTPHAPGKSRAKLPLFDPVWNRTRAVYESKSALFAPTPARYTFRLPEATTGELRVELATPPGASAVTFTVEVDGHAAFTRAVSAADSGTWFHVTVPLAGARQVIFATSGDSAAPSSPSSSSSTGAATAASTPTAAFWGNPQLVVAGAGAPGLNVLLVVIDTLRVDALPVMPHLRKLASTGVSFEQAVTAATWTRPSILAMLGGDLPTAIGQSAEEMIPTDGERRRFYAVAPPLLPRVLENRGYLASAIGNNFFLLGYPQIGLALGFDEVADIRHPVLDTPAITRAAIGYLQAHAKESFFLHLHYDAPHWPNTPPPEYKKSLAVPNHFPADPMAADYLAEAAYVDDYVGRVIDELERLGLSRRTLVVVVGDHGEVFDHAHSHTVDALQQPTLHHHGWSAYDEILRIPFVMALPGTLPVASVKSQVSLVDLQPTVLDVLGLAPRKDARGRSLAPLWRGEPEPERPAFTEGQNVRTLRAGGWLYLRRGDEHLTLPDGKHVRASEELYDLLLDPLQHVNRAHDLPDVLRRLRAQFEREAPAARDAPVSVLHLRLAPDGRPHTVDGTLRSDGTISVRAVAGAEASPLDAHGVRLTLRGPALVDLVIDPPTASVELALRRDGTPLGPGELLVGPFGLPLLADQPRTRFDGDRLLWLEAARAPVLGERGDVLLWRDPSAITPLGTQAARQSSEVAGMMRRWGYAQPGK